MWLELSKDVRLETLDNISKSINLAPEAIEKDWWVTMALAGLFKCGPARAMVFKGGTSLSKGWKLIERFSEDIDLAIDRVFFGFDGELKRKDISRLRRESCSYIRTTLKEELDANLKAMGVSGYRLTTPESTDTTVDPQIIELHYQSLFDTSGYIPGKILIEIGSRSLIEPSANIPMRSMIGEAYPAQPFADEVVLIPTVVPARTFLEKAFLLHEEFSKPTEQIRTDRLTRHLYDLERLMDTKYAAEALSDSELYRAIVEHRRKYTSMKEVDYATHSPLKICFIPPVDIQKRWADDYISMQMMIYGDSLTFEKLIERITELNERFREVNFEL